MEYPIFDQRNKCLGSSPDSIRSSILPARFIIGNNTTFQRKITMDVSILYEDDDLLVLNKPSGVTVNTSDTTTGEQTLQNWVEEYRGLVPYVRHDKEKIAEEGKQETYKTPDEEFTSRAGIVHRLDKETSGIILVAKHVGAFTNLQAQFKQRTVEKTYLALSHGWIKQATGKIDVPVGRLPWNRKHFGVLSGGREAITHYEVVAEYELPLGKDKEKVTLVRLFPKTGRTHQIRVHLKYINHPIFADFLYAGRKTSRNDRMLLSRVFLHAASIKFSHPRGEEMFFEAPFPSELQKIMDLCVRVLA
jgi:23S rRNA pseudouridine1911/1915/1917 synthase